MSESDTELKACVRELFKYLDAREVSDGGNEFSPTYITSCRCMVVEKLKVLLPRLKALAEDNA
jgi:hypothetical protein